MCQKNKRQFMITIGVCILVHRQQQQQKHPQKTKKQNKKQKEKKREKKMFLQNILI